MIADPIPLAALSDMRYVAQRTGYRIEEGMEGGWLLLRSHTLAAGSVALAASGPDGPFHLALRHPGVIAEIGLPPDGPPGPGLARITLSNRAALDVALGRAYDLAVSLPDAPLSRFRAETTDLPRVTEAERLTVQRVGQGIFRDALLDYWQGRCPLTGITEPALLRASHIVPWAECDDAERLDVHNGLLLSALWDAAFDRHLVTFGPDGTPAFSPTLDEAARAALVWHAPLPLTDAHRPRLARHAATARATWST